MAQKTSRRRGPSARAARKSAGEKAAPPPDTLTQQPGASARNKNATRQPGREGLARSNAHTNKDFPVVGVGASAGGLEAFTQLLRKLPTDTGMAFVLVQHLDRKHESLLSELLGKTTPMPVVEAKEGMAVQPNHIYVIPPNALMSFSRRKLSARPRTESYGLHLPIDHFLSSLAADQQHKAVGIILNEELETAKEELQSANEELNTLNEEVHHRNQELSRVNTDLINLLASVELAIVMVTSDLRIRRFNPFAEQVLHLVPSDVGRFIGDLKTNLPDIHLEELIGAAERDTTLTRDVQDRTGRWWSLRIRPYKTAEGKNEGAVLILVDVDPVRRSLEESRQARDYIDYIVESLHESLLVLDEHLRVVRANGRFYGQFQVTPPETQNQLIFDLGNRQWDIPKLRNLLEQVISSNLDFHSFEVDHDFPSIGYKSMLLNARPVQIGDKRLILLAIEDLTERKRAEVERLESEKKYQLLSARLLQVQDEERRRIARELHDSTAQELAALAMNLSLLAQSAGSLTPKARKALEESIPLADRASREIHVLSYLLHPPLLDEVGLEAAIRWFADGLAQRSGIQVSLDISSNLGRLPQDQETVLFRIVQESLTNIHRHSASKVARIQLHRDTGKIILVVEDEGRGLSSEKLKGAQSTGAPDSSLLGVGIIGMRERARQVGGELSIESGEGGTTVRAELPLSAPSGGTLGWGGLDE